MTRRAAVPYLAVVTAIMTVGTVISWGREALFDTLLYSGLLPGVLACCGVLVAGRHPTNPIGWLFCGFALFTSIAELAEGYGHLATARGLPSGELGEWVITWSWLVELAFWLAILLLFPDGRLPSRRWRTVLWVGLAGISLALPGAAMDAGNSSAFARGANPFGVDHPVIGRLFSGGMTITIVALLAAIGSVGLRLRRAQGVERQQLKWFAYAAAAMGLIAPFAVIFWYRTTIVHLPMALALSAIPVAATVAILRYRLYDIDVVISTTLVYGALTATLALTYLGLVLFLQLAFSALSERSDIAVAGSTLAVAALFRPARARIQAFVDRRFYRSRYDAARTLERFNVRLRDELDLGALHTDLLGVVRDTMQPAHVSVWLASRGRPG